MAKTILVALLHRRRETSAQFQSVLAEFGCIIKTRLGIHDGVLDRCTDEGLIILELVGETKQVKDLESRLDEIEGVNTEVVNISL
jgi:hypothetical protein